MSQAPAPAIGRAWLESRKAVDDGYIWPFPRHQMQARGAIRKRMVEDIQEMVHDGGAEAVVTIADLLNKGWPGETVLAHGVIAFQMFRAENGPTPKPIRLGSRRDSVRHMARDAVALGLFIASTLLIAGVTAGAI
ncbi:hypothetical protein FG93_05515 [Bosea sp. LC85]|uniref:hypothetical protein n=1 Tax=Bosea sp. LC85 TaxID=1502851 RepID=UPI0004E31634|nr:hypothetical protein [Bosea sp. LC85]KFC64005.1 hypothetical protein FG93_05515 [Bosea sp. LC85]